MKKLSNIKVLVTVAEAAKHLSAVCEEPVTEADVLDLVLGGRLRLFINFINTVYARKRHEKVSRDEAGERMIVPIPSESDSPDLDKPIALQGHYEVLMWDDEFDVVKELRQTLAGGIPVRRRISRGITVIKVDDGSLLQLYTSRDDDETCAGSHAQALLIEREIGAGNVSETLAKLLRSQHRKSRQELVDRKAESPDSWFHLARDFPRDSELLIRTSELREIETSMTTPDEQPRTGSEKNLSTIERNSLLKMVLGMAIVGYGYDPAGAKSDVPKTIESDLTLKGIRVTDDTIRKYLDEAVEHFLPKGR